MKNYLIAVSCALFATIATASPQWTWEAGKQTNNGSITIKSTSGSTTYSSTQNPTGAVAKVNQSATTQPPTVIIQATSGGSNFFDNPETYLTTNCWIFTNTNYAPQLVIGRGKLTGNLFTGHLAYLSSGGVKKIPASLQSGAASVYTGSIAFNSNTGGTRYYYCGSGASCAWNYGYDYGGSYISYNVVGAAALPITSPVPCNF